MPDWLAAALITLLKAVLVVLGLLTALSFAADIFSTAIGAPTSEPHSVHEPS